MHRFAFPIFAGLLVLSRLASAQTIANTSTSATYSTVAGTNTLAGGDIHTYTGTAANGAVLMGAGHSLLINGTLESTDTGGGPRAVRLANTAGTYTIDVGSAGIIRAQSNDAFKQQNTGSAINLTNDGEIRALSPVPNAPYTTSVGQALDFDGNTATSSIINNATGLIRADGADAIRVGSNMAITNNGSIIGNSKINDNAVNNNSSYNATNTFDTSEAVDFRSASGASLINNGTISGTRHGVDGDVTATNITITNNSTGSIIGLNGSGIGSDATSATVTNYQIDNHGTIRGDYAGVGNIVDRSGTAGIDGDGDGIDIDGAATIINRSTGSIKGTGAGGFDSNGRANGSEAISIGGGTITNDGIVEGADNAFVVNNDSVASRSGVAATSITNNASGSITGLNGFAIRFENKLGTVADNDTIVNYGIISGSGAIPNPAATITRQYGEADINSVGTLDGVSYTGTGSSRFIKGDGSAIQTGEGNDSLTNYGTITGNNGRAISMEGGNDTLTVSGGSATITGIVNGGVGTDTLNFSPGAGNTFAASFIISNFENIDVNAGKTNLTATGSGNGAISVKSAGELNIGASANAGDVIVESGGKLSGSGAAGTISLLAGATLAPGNSAGTLSATAMTWDAGAEFRFELGATSDQLILTGAFLKGVDGTFEFVFSDAGGLSTGLDNLITFNSTDFDLSDFTFTTLTPGLNGNFVLGPTGLGFNVTAVPEPSALGLAVIGLLLVVGRSRTSRSVKCY